ncbi:MAG: DegQ family serine endoprotease [Thiomonas sp.]|uniref:DegQ family serine endoprotease n=1 Tax=Thiomonas sp. TaxID=2047785 RepID=UPI002A360D79|nr:DegQ family serine endoprotease [Thiomonas sp.]MDY0329643.1 DegQ family serine endoprotease [Thiomonas sp.]
MKKVLLTCLSAGLLAMAGIAVPAQAAGSAPQQPCVACGLPDFTGLVEKAGPSVVNIRTFKKVPVGSGDQMDEQTRELLRRFFGVPIPAPDQPKGGKNGPQDEEEERPTGVGSGFVISPDGYIMTNAHVVDGADEIMVTLTDKREFKAKLIGADKRTDVALVKIDAKQPLPAVRIGDSSRVKVGEWVVAIGSPFGLENTVTAGIVSAKGRDTGDYTPFIQTDVAVNPGNSGGPLIDMRGNVIGINSQIYSRTGGFMGISFAIPIDEAMRVVEQLKKQGYVVRGKIGVQIDNVSRDLAESLGLGQARGALVRVVEKDGPADKAGVQVGDIVTRFNGKPVERANDLPRLVGETKPDTTVPMQVLRMGKSLTLNVTVGEWVMDRKPGAKPAEEQKPEPVSKANALGVRVIDLNEAQKRQLGVSSGVLVEAVRESAARDGLRVGDVVLAVGNTAVNSAAQFNAISAQLPPGKQVAVLVRRGDSGLYILLRPQN